MTLSLAEYASLDGLGLAGLVRNGSVSPEELLETAVAAANALDPALNAIVHTWAAEAREEARRGGRAAYAGDRPFPGVPFLVKNLQSTVAGRPITSGSRLLADHVAREDSEMVRRYRASGVVIFGNTNSPEFGLLPVTEPVAHGPTRNPWDPERTPGGSSGGSAAAVAARVVPMAGGGDGGGSIRIPAACCGLFGLKPSRGRTPSGPDREPGWRGFAVEHVITRSVRDSAAMLDAVSAPEIGATCVPRPPEGSFLEAAHRDPHPLRVAWTCEPLLGSEVSPEAVRGVEESVALLEGLGHACTEVTPALEGRAFARDFLTVLGAELAADLSESSHLAGRRIRASTVEPETRALALAGDTLRASELATALRQLEGQARRFAALLDPYDVLVTPTLAFPPVRIGELGPSSLERSALSLLGRLRSGRLVLRLGLVDRAAADAFRFVPWTPVFNVMGRPAMSVPLHWTAGNLPMGTHVVGRYGEEATLLSLAGQLERAAPWSERRPTICVAGGSAQ